MEAAQEMVCCPVEPGPARHLEPPALLDELSVQKQPDGVGAVHPPDLIYLGPRGRLVVGDDSKDRKSVV